MPDPRYGRNNPFFASQLVGPTSARMHFNKLHLLEEEMCNSCFRTLVSYLLEEPNEHLVGYAMRKYGRANVKWLTYGTAEIENVGGMLTKDGTRRRTPGGTFIKAAKLNFKNYK